MEMKTPLYDRHVAAGARVIEFGGWLMPVQYAGILEEHRAVRERAGLFDVSHMGEVVIAGTDAAAFVNHLIVNEAAALAPGRIAYSPMCYPDGGTVDDLLAYRVSSHEYLLVINAGNIAKDVAWINEQAAGWQVAVTDVSAETGEVALQGPAAARVLGRLADKDLSAIAYFGFLPKVLVAGRECLVSRTGYTGEDGFEIYCSPADVGPVWDAILEEGAQDGVAPVGLGARDTLRFEACLPLYGHELSSSISPLEAGLGRFVALGKQDFIGRDALLRQTENGLVRRLAGIEMTGRGIARAGYRCLSPDGKVIGTVTSGTFSPTLGKNLALALLDTGWTGEGTELAVEIREKPVEARTTATPFYRRRKAR